MRLDGKVALITGGESDIGLATARRFAAEGAALHLVGIDAARLEAAATELGCSSAVADVSDEAAVRTALAAGAAAHGRFDVIFSNAGISGEIAPLTEFPSDGFARVLAVHVLGAFHVLKHGIPHVPDGGSIIITSSVVGLIGAPEIAAVPGLRRERDGHVASAVGRRRDERVAPASTITHGSGGHRRPHALANTRARGAR